MPPAVIHIRKDNTRLFHLDKIEIFFLRFVKLNISSNLHLLKVLLPAKLAHLGTLLLHVLSTGVFGVGLDFALDGRIEGPQEAGSQESRIDAVVNTDSCDGDT